MAIPTAVVTGASGYIGSELVKQLLEKGYNVRGTVRDPSNKQKVAHLQALADALPGKLELYAADLLQLGSFDEAVRGVDIVFHTASPFQQQVEDPQRDLVDPAVKGTTNLMDSVVKHKNGIKRVVLTSSVAAVRSTKSPAPPKNGELYTCADWNESSTLESEPYPLSKVLAEKAAWDIAKREGISLVTINPVFVVGPVISSRVDATSIRLLKDVLEGRATTFATGNLWYVSVQDVARAHVRAAEVTDARGRYLVAASECSLPGSQVVDILKARFPNITSLAKGEPGEQTRKLDISKLTQLDIKPISEAEALGDMAQSLIALGVAQPTFA